MSKVRFKDGSVADIDDSLLEKAKQAGASVIDNEPVSGNIQVRFKDGSTSQIRANLADKAIAAGAEIIKKKDTPSSTNSGNGLKDITSVPQSEDGLTKTGNVVDGIPTVAIDEKPPKKNIWDAVKDLKYESGIKPEFQSALENPTAEGINSIVNAGAKKRVDDRNAKRAALSLQSNNEVELRPQEFDEEGTRPSAFPATPQQKERVALGKDNTVTTNDYTEKGDSKFEENIKDRFYSGKVTPEDVSVVINNSKDVSKKVSAEEIAASINKKAKKLNEFALEVSKDPLEYAIGKKVTQDALDELVEQRFNAVSEEDAAAIDGKIKELKGQMDFNARAIAPRLQVEKNKVFEELKDMLEGRAKAFGWKYNKDDARKLINDYMQENPNPYLIAEQGFSGAAPFAINTTDGSKIPQREAFAYKGKDGKVYGFKNDDYNELIEKINFYFEDYKPAAKSASLKFSEDDMLLIEAKQKAGKIFSGENLKNLDSLLSIQADSIVADINKTGWEKIEQQPAFNTIKEVYQNKLNASPETNIEEAKNDFYKSLESDATLKPFFDKMAIDRKAQLGILNKKREDYINNGIKSISPVISYEMLQKAEKDGLFKKYDEEVGKEISYRKEQQKLAANKAESDQINTFGSFSYSLQSGLNKGTDGMIEAFARYFNITSVRDEYSNKRIEDEKWEGDYIKNHSKFNGWTSLLDPSYYAYNAGQSLPYMAPAIVAGVATGGAGGVALAAGLNTVFETAANALDTRNEMFLHGVNKYGEKLSSYEADIAAAENFKKELLPNLILSYVEFGSLLRGIKGIPKTGLKKTIGGEVLGATSDLLQTGGAEAFQEGIQGYIQQSAKDKAQGKPVMDIFDYMQTDDFRQNFFGGLSGGIGFGAFGFGKRIAKAPGDYNNWKSLLETAGGNLAEFDKSALRSYALNEELNGRGAQFRDQLAIRLYDDGIADEEERKVMHNTLLYSEALKAYGKKFSLGNINGLATAHNLIMADSYEKAAKAEGDNAMGKVLKETSNRYLGEAKRIMDGNTDGVFYISNISNGAPVFLSKKDAEVLAANGTIQNMYDKGIISGASENIPVNKRGGFTEAELSAVQGMYGKDFTKSKIIKPFADVIQSSTATVKEKKTALKELSDQLLATTTSPIIGSELGQKLSEKIEALGYEAPKENVEIKEALAPKEEVEDLGDEPDFEKEMETIENTRLESIKNVVKPVLSLELNIPEKTLVKSTDRIGNIKERDSIKNDFDSLKDIISCIYG